MDLAEPDPNLAEPDPNSTFLAEWARKIWPVLQPDYERILLKPPTREAERIKKANEEADKKKDKKKEKKDKDKDDADKKKDKKMRRRMGRRSRR